MAGRPLAVCMALNVRRIGHAFRWSVLTLLIGCSGGASDRGAAQVQRLRWDSLGVVVRESDPAFHSVELTDPRGILSSPSGLVAVAEADLHKVILLDSTGSIVGRIGRQGAGPGEFDAVSLVAFWGDSLAAYDAALHRLSFIRRNGDLIRQRTIAPMGLVASTIIGFRPDGAPILLGLAIGRPTGSSTILPATGVVVALLDDTRRDIIAVVGGGSWFPRGPYFFAARPSVGVTDSGVWLGAGSTPEVMFVPFSRMPPVTFHWTATTRPVTDADKSVVREYAAARHAAPELTGDDRFADSIPYFKTILPDPAGGVWLVGYSALGTAPDSAWRVNERTGTIHGIQLPAGFRPAEIGTRDLIGVQIDSEGAQRLARYRRGRH